jgi:hypothetical protein
VSIKVTMTTEENLSLLPVFTERHIRVITTSLIGRTNDSVVCARSLYILPWGFSCNLKPTPPAMSMLLPSRAHICLHARSYVIPTTVSESDDVIKHCQAGRYAWNVSALVSQTRKSPCMCAKELNSL